MRKLVIDVKLMRPACVLLQACLGGDSSVLSRHFDAEDWLTSPTKDMRMVRGTDEQWAAFAGEYSVLGKLRKGRDGQKA